MKLIQHITLLLTLGLFISCGSKEAKKTDRIEIGQKSTVVVNKEAKKSDVIPTSKQITLDNKGVGKIKNIELAATIDAAMVEKGKALFKTNCTTCHKTKKRFIGPKISGVLNRRSPEWVMNMIINPELMIKKDQTAKDLLKEFNNTTMLNQNITETQARNILEYFRTLE